METIMKEYASALFELSIEENRVDEIFEMFKHIVDAFQEHQDFGKLLSHPKISRQEKHGIIDQVFMDIDKTVKHFLFVLVDRDRLSEIEAIFDEFQKLYHEYHHVLPVLVIASTKLTSTHLNRLEIQLTAKYRRKIKLEQQVDSSLLGGIRVVVKDQVIDYSVQSQLSELRSMILNSN